MISRCYNFPGPIKTLRGKNSRVNPVVLVQRFTILDPEFWPVSVSKRRAARPDMCFLPILASAMPLFFARLKLSGFDRLGFPLSVSVNPLRWLPHFVKG